MFLNLLGGFFKCIKLRLYTFRFSKRTHPAVLQTQNLAEGVLESDRLELIWVSNKTPTGSGHCQGHCVRTPTEKKIQICHIRCRCVGLSICLCLSVNLTVCYIGTGRICTIILFYIDRYCQDV